LKKYEAIFILDIRKVDDEGAAFSREFSELIEKQLNGKMVSVDAMGRLQFSYEIKKRKAGIYYNFVFEVEESGILSIKDKFRLDERILRNMIIVFDRPDNVKGKLKDLKDLADAPAPAPVSAE